MTNRQKAALGVLAVFFGALFAFADRADSQVRGDTQCVRTALFFADQAGYDTSGMVQMSLPAGEYEITVYVYDSYIARGITSIKRTEVEQLSERVALLGTVTPDLPDFVDPGSLTHTFGYTSPGIDSFEVSLVSDGLSANSLEVPQICATPLLPPPPTSAPTTMQTTTTQPTPSTEAPTTEAPTSTTQPPPVVPPSTQPPATQPPTTEAPRTPETVPESEPAEPIIAQPKFTG